MLFLKPFGAPGRGIGVSAQHKKLPATRAHFPKTCSYHIEKAAAKTAARTIILNFATTKAA